MLQHILRTTLILSILFVILTTTTTLISYNNNGTLLFLEKKEKYYYYYIGQYYNYNYTTSSYTNSSDNNNDDDMLLLPTTQQREEQRDDNDDDDDGDGDDDCDDNPHRHALRQELKSRRGLSDNEMMKHWYARPTPPTTIHVPPDGITTNCSQPKLELKNWTSRRFFPDADVVETEFFSQQQKHDLKQRLSSKNGSSSKTIRDAFMPWIEKDGFDLDLILHAGNVMLSMEDSSGIFVGIFNGTVYFPNKEKYATSAKALLLADHLESVMDMLRLREGIDNNTIPDIIFPYALGSWPASQYTHRNCAQQSLVPKHLWDRYDSAPVAGIAMDPNVHAGIALLPNMYFGDMQAYTEHMEKLLDGGDLDTNWSHRHNKVFWRGQISDDFESNLPRIQALQVVARNANRKRSPFDIKVTKCKHLEKMMMMQNHTTQESSSSPSSSSTPPWLPTKDFLNLTKCSRRNNVPHSKFTNYQAHLNLPGSSKGSYSRNLQSLWPTGAAVLIWEQSAVEFYYDTLEAGVTHVWVNETNFESMTELILSDNGKLAKLLGSVARDWFQNHLSGDAILDYYVQWFQAWAALQRFVPTPEMISPNSCTCSGWVDTTKINNKNHHSGQGRPPPRCKWCAKYPRDKQTSYKNLMGEKLATSS